MKQASKEKDHHDRLCRVENIERCLGLVGHAHLEGGVGAVRQAALVECTVTHRPVALDLIIQRRFRQLLLLLLDVIHRLVGIRIGAADERRALGRHADRGPGEESRRRRWCHASSFGSRLF